MLFPNIKKRQEMSETNDSDRAKSDAVPQPKEVGTICCPGPSCSTADSPTGADPENAGLDQALEMFARSYNLTAQNVKNIIFHIVKNPQTFATLVRKDPDAMAGLRITRARLRHLERIARRRIPTVRLRPIAAPKTFLDINYGDDEDGDDETGGAGRTDGMKADGGRAEEQEDMDYCPDKDPTATTRRSRKRGRRKHKNTGQHAEDKEESSSFSSDTDFVGSDVEEEEEEANGHGTTVGTEEPPKVVQDGVGGGGQRPVVMGAEEEELTRQSVEFLTKVDNPIYPIFIKSLATETEMDLDRQQLYNEDDDSEYVFQDFDDLCEQEDEYEFRRDRATEIPRWEVKALEQDFEDEEDGVGAHPTSLDVPIEPIVGEETTTNGGQNKGVDEMVGCDKESTVKVFWRTNIAKPSTNPRLTEQCPQHSSDGNGAASTSTPKAAQAEDGPAKDDGIQQPTSSSCSLLNASPTIDRVELDALKVQLEKHVQLLCQAIVGTSQYPKMVDSHNKAMLMLRELDALACERSQQSVFNVPTLEAAIYSAHDIKACREVELAPGGGEQQQQHHQSGNDEQRPSNETMWVLSRSGAVRHPELLFSYRFSDGNAQAMRTLTPPPRFLPSEQLLLAIGLYQLNGVPARQSKACKMRNRFQLIQQHFLPTKRVDQIRNHIRNVHACPSPNIYHQLIMEAEKGHFPVTCRLDLGDKAQQKAPIEWPNELQPFWLKWLSSLLRNSQTQMFMMDDGVDHQNCVEMQQNDICSGLQQQSTSPSFLPKAAVLSTNQCPKQSDNNPTTTSSPSGNDSCFNPSASSHEPEIQHPAQQQPQAASSSLSHDDVDNLSTSPHELEIAAQYTAQQQQKKLKLLPRILSRKRCIASSSTMAQKAAECHQSKSLSFICAELLGKVVDEQDDVGGDDDDDDNNNGGDKIVGIQTRWRKRLRTASSIEDGGGGGSRHVRGGNGATSINAGGSADGAEGSATTSTSRTTEHNDNANKNINNKSIISCNNVLPGTPPQSQQKKSRRHERAERGLAALCDKHAREQTDRALGTAIYEDFKKRMFMHQDKLRAVQRVLASRDVSSVAQCFASLCELMGSTHPEMFRLFAALAPEALVPPALRVDPQWQACKRALRMLQTIHTYLAASRTPAQMKHMLKFLREASVDITSEQLFFETLQRQFAVREEPLWRLLRREWMSAKFVETVEDWEYEFVDMDKQQQQPKQTGDGVDADQADEQRFEHVRLPYRYDPSERRRLRVRHGRVTAELNGRLCNVAIGYAPPEELSGPSLAVVAQPLSSTAAPVAASSTIHPIHDTEQQPQNKRIPGDVQQQQTATDRCWTRKMDMELMLSYNKAGGDTKKCVDIFMHNSGQVESDELKNVDKVERRLEQLLSVVSTLRRPNDKCH